MSIRLLIEQIEADNREQIWGDDFKINAMAEKAARTAAKECKMEVYNQKDVKMFLMGMRAVANNFGPLPPHPDMLIDMWSFGDEEGILFGKYLQKYGYNIKNRAHKWDMHRICKYLENTIYDGFFPYFKMKELGADDDVIDEALSVFWTEFVGSVMPTKSAR